MGWTCIDGVYDDSGSLWTYVTIDCDTGELALAIGEANLPDGDCKNPQAGSCWGIPEGSADTPQGKNPIRIMSDGMDEDQKSLAVEMAKKIMGSNSQYHYSPDPEFGE